jgi:hypothetical protein
VVSYFDLGPEALSGDPLAFTAYFEDGTSGVYLATIPEAGTDTAWRSVPGPMERVRRRHVRQSAARVAMR